MADPIQDLKKIMLVTKKLAEQEKKSEATVKKQIKSVAKLPKPKLVISGLVKSYMEAVKKTDGLTSVRPATVKAVQTAEKDPSKFAKAVAELNNHIKDLKASKDKKAKVFQKALLAIIQQLKVLG